MSRPKNNIARLPWEVREIIARMLFDGATYGEIRAAIAPEAPGVKLHSSSFAAYAAGAEYKKYADRRRQWDAAAQERRTLAAAITADGSIETAMQAAEYLALRNIIEQLQSGELDPNDTPKMANAVARFRGSQVADLKADHKRRIERIEAEHDADCAEYDADIAELKTQIAQLRNMLEEAAGARSVDPAKVAEGLDQVLGIKRD